MNGGVVLHQLRDVDKTYNVHLYTFETSAYVQYDISENIALTYEIRGANTTLAM